MKQDSTYMAAREMTAGEQLQQELPYHDGARPLQAPRIRAAAQEHTAISQRYERE